MKGLKMEAIAACYIGGASARGGIGTVLGAVIGVSTAHVKCKKRADEKCNKKAERFAASDIVNLYKIYGGFFMKTSYAEEQKRKLVKRYFNGESASVICLRYGVPRSTFYSWTKSYQVVGTALESEVNAVNYAKQKKRIDRLENMVEVLQTVDCSLSSPLQIKLRELEKLYGQYSVHVLCDSLDVPRGTLYNHILRNKKDMNSYRARREKLSKSISEVFEESNQIYGSRKIRAVLQSRGINTTDEMVAELMQTMNLKSVRSDTKRQHRRLGLLERKTDALKLEFTANAPNQIWVSDVTYFRLFNTTLAYMSNH